MWQARPELGDWRSYRQVTTFENRELQLRLEAIGCKVERRSSDQYSDHWERFWWRVEYKGLVCEHTSLLHSVSELLHGFTPKEFKAHALPLLQQVLAMHRQKIVKA